MIESITDGICETLFRPGSRVECVDGEFSHYAQSVLTELPLAGSVYTIESFDYIRRHSGEAPSPCIRLAELQSRSRERGLARPSWDILRFRLLMNEENREVLMAWKNFRAIIPGLGDLMCSKKSDPRFATNLLSAFLSLEGWADLAGSNVNLAMMIANCPEYDGLPEKGSADRKLAYMQMKRGEVCRAMGFPARESSVRMLAKTRLGMLDGQGKLLVSLLRMLTHHDPIATRLLGQLKTIAPWEITSVGLGFPFSGLENAMTPEEVDTMEWFFSRTLQERALVMDSWRNASFWKGTIVNILAAPLRRIASFHKCTTAAAWYSSQEKIRRRIHYADRRVCERMGSSSAWPDPPIPPAEGIEPIQSAAALVDEGNEMRHCSAKYVGDVLAGKNFFYRVKASRRCTLSLAFLEDRWKIDDLRTVGNVHCSDPDILKVINEWLESHDCSRPGNQRREFLLAVAAEAGVKPFREDLL